MPDTCTQPCSFVREHLYDMLALRNHLLHHSGCVTAWIAMARLVPNLRYRLDCWQRAALLAPQNDDIQEGYLRCRLEVDPGDRQAREELSQRRVERALRNYRAKIFLRMRPSRALGEILLDMGAISDLQLEYALNHQRELKQRGTPMMLGDVMVALQMITPIMLAHALITQHRERLERGESAHVLGEYLVARGYIGLQDLEKALLEQTRLRQLGERPTIGDILIRQNAIDAATLDYALTQQTSDAYSSYV